MFKNKLLSWIGVCLWIVAAIIATPLAAAKVYDPPVVYLTWQRAPDTTMTILWITEAERDSDILYYQRYGETRWHQACGGHAPLPEGHTEFLLHNVELTGLKPDNAYRFRTGSDAVVHSFKTMPPHLKQPLRFIIGGDIYHDSLDAVIETAQQAALFNPSFALLGGDLSYAAGKRKPEEAELWERWIDLLRAWKEHMVTPEGHLVPILPTTSNEDIKGKYNQSPENALFFLALFPTPGLPGYKVIDFADYMSIWLLDSGHLNPIDGKQTQWLADTLKTRQKIPHKIAIYHVPAYPSRRSIDNPIPSLIRASWVPLFERYGIEVAFEHHDHAYKRTKLILDNKIDPKGVLYMGDGGFGVSTPRTPHDPAKIWYLEKTAAKRHFIAATIDIEQDNFKAIDHKGFVFDEVTIKPR